MSAELEPQRDCHLTGSSAAYGEIPRSWVYWSIAIGLAFALLTMLLAELVPLPHHGHHMAFADAFNIAWKVALLPPGAVTARIAIDRINLSQREHWHAVQVARDSEFDAAQRRITELSAKASDQLGSDKATVRIGGLTDLERLGQNSPDLRQTVVDRICAYLQMPYTMPAPTALPHADDEARQEKMVRLTAQRILSHHTRHPKDEPEPPETFWPGITLDLSDGTLIDFNMTDCHVVSSNFTSAIFDGDAQFDGMQISQGASFLKATFRGSARFTNATFGTLAEFSAATFSTGADFSNATFSGGASFITATFSGVARFGATTFSEDAYFTQATFTADASFTEATFSKDAYFPHTQFSEYAYFGDVKFSEDAHFGSVKFSEDADFSGATFSGTADFDHAEVSSVTVTETPDVSTTDLTLVTVDPVSRHLVIKAPPAPPDATTVPKS